jgi:hypothetical protein
MKPLRRAHSVGDPGTSALAAIISHELNNIAVPMDGFAELAVQNTALHEPVRYSLDEMRIAIGRIKALASDLESLAENGSRPAPIAIGDCMPDAADADALRVDKIDWQCGVSTVVTVDRAHARRAIHSLAVIAARGTSQFTRAPDWSVSVGPAAAGARCVACGATTRRKDIFVFVQAYGSHSVTSDALRDPLGCARVGRANRRLTLAALVHSAHGAGGHILQNETAGTLMLAFPVN